MSSSLVRRIETWVGLTAGIHVSGLDDVVLCCLLGDRLAIISRAREGLAHHARRRTRNKHACSAGAAASVLPLHSPTHRLGSDFRVRFVCTPSPGIWSPGVKCKLEL